MAGATETTPDLEALSKAATGGTWYGSGTGHLCAKGLPHGTRVLTCEAQHSERFDVTFIVALVNAFRAGDLIDRAAHEAAISEARAEGFQAGLDASVNHLIKRLDSAGDHPTANAMRRVFEEQAVEIRALTDTPQETSND